MKCDKCNFENNETNKFCENCGNKLQMIVVNENLNNNEQNNLYNDNQSIENDNFKKTKKERLGSLIGGLFFLVIGCFLTFISFFLFGPFLGSPYLIGGVVLISNYVFNKKNLKIVMSVVFSILFILLISIAAYSFWTRPSGKDGRNLMEEQKKYFDYALEDYTYTYEYFDDIWCKNGVHCYQYKRYTIDFYDNLGKKQQIIIDSDDDFEEDLSSSIETYLNSKFKIYEEKINEKIEKSELYKFLDKKRNTNSDDEFFIHTYIATSKIDDNINYSDIENGVYLKSINFKNLKENNIKAELGSVIKLNCSANDIKKIEDYLVNIYGEYLKLFEYDNIQYSFIIHDVENKDIKYILKIDSSNNFYWEVEEE